MKVYIEYDYRDPQIVMHSDQACRYTETQARLKRRVVSIDVNNLVKELTNFRKKVYRFGGGLPEQDLWLYIHLSNKETEEGLVHVIQEILGEHYRPIKGAEVLKHC
jgi:hypothetical protein